MSASVLRLEIVHLMALLKGFVKLNCRTSNSLVGIIGVIVYEIR